MDKRIIALCAMLFILIICTTVNANDISDTNDTTAVISQEVNDNINLTTTTTEPKKEVTKTASNSITKNIKTQSSKEENQNVQTTNDDTILVKKDSSSKAINIKTDVIQNSTTLNITGIVTTAYDKKNKVYAADEDEGFAAGGVKINLYSDNTGKKIAHTTSNSSGHYQFTNLTPGVYSLEFKYGDYATGEETVKLVNSSQEINYIFVPDIVIIAFSGDSNGVGQSEKINYLKSISDRVLFLESYELNSSYDRSNQWMLNFANFILVDMYSVGNGFGVDTDLIAYSPASQNKKISYVFGIFDAQVIQGTLGKWGFLGDTPHSIENTIVGSYWQALSADPETTKTNMENLLAYIKYLLGETTVNPTKVGKGPMLGSSSWGIYYPGYKGNVKVPSQDQILSWIESTPGYNADNAGSLNWMTIDYAVWNTVNNNPEKILSDFEKWYTSKKSIKGPFIVIANYHEGGVVVDALIKEYEKQNRAVFCIYKATSEDPDMTNLLEIAGNKSVITRGVSAVSYMYWWTTGYAQRGTDYTINAYKNLNVSLLNALKDISKFSYESEYGPQNEWTAAVTMPQFEGVFGALPVSYLDENKETVLIPEGIAKHVQITNGWAKLRELNNSDKKISILVYGYPPGKANIGASYLDVFQSIHDLLEKLYDEGYDIGINKSEIPTTEELNAIISDFGNKGLWAEGLLDLYVIQNYDELTKYGQLVDEKTYNKWYKQLPKTLQEELTQSWGSGLGNGSMIYREKVVINFKELNNWLKKQSDDFKDQFMHYWNLNKKKIIIKQNSDEMIVNKTRFYQWFFELPSNLQKTFNKSAGFQLLNDTRYRNEGYFLIPGKFFGNVFLSIQPLRGWESQIDFHNSYLPPPQQYIAYYKYLAEIFETNAVIHMGTHGTLEWLPGRNLGLQSTDWPFQLIETPIIYPYIVSNPGEGMVAKERSFSQVITHMTPVTATTSLYGDYVELNDAISRYDSSKSSGVEDNIIYYRSLILNLTESLGYEQPDYVVVSHYLEDYYIALENGATENEINEAKKNLTQKATILGYDIPKDNEFEGWLEELEKYLNSNEAFEEWLSIIHADIEGLSSDKINSGMHTLGMVWNDTEMITGVTSIVSSRTNILDDIMHLYYPEIKGSYYDKIKERGFNAKKETINGILSSIVTSLVEGNSVENVSASHGVFNTSSDFYEDLLEIEDTIIKIRNNMEWESIMTALSGGYVPPGLSADPLYSDVIPTGRSMYVSDTTKIPSKSAWQSAVNSINEVLIKYMINLGEETFPELVGEVIWGTEVLRTEGISLAQFLYLLGVKPVWDKTGKVTGIELMPLEDLTLTIDGTIYERPRIDVFATMVCNNPNWISLMTDAIELVNSLNESTNDNYVKKHYNETGSLERLFGLPGAILEGTGVADLLNNAGTNLNESSGIADELASVYETRLSHSWNTDSDGNIIVKDDPTTFTYLLEHLDLIIQNLDSTWRYFDSDDYVDWFGGLLNAANVHGSIVNTVLLDIRDKNNVVTNTLGEEVKKETRTTLLNPQWLGAMTGDVGGWNQMSMNFENLMKTMLTTQNYKENQAGKAVLDTSEGNNAGIIGDGLLKELAKTITYSEYFTIDAQYKSYAFQSMSGWLLTSDMAGYWKTNDNTLRKDLLQKYVDNANRYGVACCHHTCGNINFHDWIIRTGAALGVKGLSEYSQIYASATKNPNAIYYEQSTSESTASTEGTGTVDINEGINEYVNQGAVSEANAVTMAGAGASGLTDESVNNGNALAQSMTMAQSNIGSGETGTGTGSQEGGNGNGTGSDSGEGENTNTGTGSGNETEGNGSGSSSNTTTEPTDPTEQTEPSEQTETNKTTEPTEQTEPTEPTETNKTTEPTEPTEQTEPSEPTETNKTTEPTEPTEQTEPSEPTETNKTTEPATPSESATDNNNTSPSNQTTPVETKTEVNNTSTSTQENQVPKKESNDGKNNTIVDNTDSGAGETPSSGEPSSGEPSSGEPSAPGSPSSGGASGAGESVTPGSSSVGGESGSSSAASAIYEVVKKNIGKPPAPQAEISFAYLLFIVLILLIFFAGFVKPNIRAKK